MTLPTSGGISSAQILAELGRGYPLNSTDKDLRTLGGVGAAMSIPGNFYGKSSYTPMTITPNHTDGNANSNGSAGTVAGSASVSVSGGNPGYSFNWVALSNPSGVSFSNGASSSSVSKSFSSFTDTTYTIQLRCDVTDSTGHTVSSATITVNLNVSNT